MIADIIIILIVLVRHPVTSLCAPAVKRTTVLQTGAEEIYSHLKKRIISECAERATVLFAWRGGGGGRRRISDGRLCSYVTALLRFLEHFMVFCDFRLFKALARGHDPQTLAFCAKKEKTDVEI